MIRTIAEVGFCIAGGAAVAVIAYSFMGAGDRILRALGFNR